MRLLQNLRRNKKMTDKEANGIKFIAVITISLLIGMFTGAIITSLRYDAEIRTDQVELKAQVEEILEQKQRTESVIREFSRQTQLIQAERESLERLKIELSRGE